MKRAAGPRGMPLVRLTRSRPHGPLSFPDRKRPLGPGTWVAHSAKRLTSAQVMISRFVSLSPASGSVLMARGLEPASESVSPSLSAPPHLHSVSLCLSKK